MRHFKGAGCPVQAVAFDSLVLINYCVTSCCNSFSSVSTSCVATRCTLFSGVANLLRHKLLHLILWYADRLHHNQSKWMFVHTFKLHTDMMTLSCCLIYSTASTALITRTRFCSNNLSGIQVLDLSCPGR